MSSKQAQTAAKWHYKFENKIQNINNKLKLGFEKRIGDNCNAPIVDQVSSPVQHRIGAAMVLTAWICLILRTNDNCEVLSEIKQHTVFPGL